MYIQIENSRLSDFEGKRLILFGAGSCGIHAIEEFKEAGAEIVAFCDNNHLLQGKELCGYPIITPESILKYHVDGVMITSTYANEIKPQLNKMGITNNYIVKMGAANDKMDKKKFHNKLLEADKGNQVIYEGLMGEKPFCISRVGSVELETLCDYCGYVDTGVYKYQPNQKYMMNINAGFFPSTDEMLDRFSRLYLNNLKIMDYIWCMWFCRFEDQIYRDIVPNTPIISYDETYLPLDEKKPWLSALEGKKILVIHPFDKSINQNYKIRGKLFTNPEFLPDFKLLTLRAVQSIAGNKTEFTDWFMALEYMKNQMDKIDYDIALIGAGAYGLPLAAYAKEQGKKAVHIGGALQLLFGIKGKAWNKLGIYNEYWTSPLESEKPNNYTQVEAGRYW